ncbi:MAG: hypothetical protein HC930_01875 [Hydrococcus sp. SU_1_0]|nr:hypothetical protein [Hydrococcus sp. SU_1_0]
MVDRVILRVRREAREQIDNNNTFITFEIEDTGAGIAPNEIDSLFQVFMQTEAGRESQEGTGLGLPISKKFVELMGGEISVSSQMAQYLGVQYLYENLDAQESDELANWEKLTSETLAMMSDEWLAELAEAATLIDERLIGQLLSQIPPEHQSLAQSIQQEVADFNFDRLINLAQTAINL